MAKPKRMSDIFTSSSEKHATILTATPPYSSEGPTLPILEGNSHDITNIGPAAHGTKNNDQSQLKSMPQQPTLHPSLYRPWSLLPPDLLTSLSGMHGSIDINNTNIISLAWTKNIAIKSGINKLKTLLGYSLLSSEATAQDTNPVSPRADTIIAVSSQSEGTAKLVSIVDMTKRIVGESEDLGGARENILWYMYISLSSIEVEKKQSNKTLGSVSVTARRMDDGDDNAMEVDEPGEVKIKEEAKSIKVPVLTIWMSRKANPAFRDAFGEQTFVVKTTKYGES